MGGHEVQPGSSPVYVLHIYENMSYDARAVGGVRCSFDVRESCIFAVCSRSKMAFCEAHEVSFFMLHDPAE